MNDPHFLVDLHDLRDRLVAAPCGSRALDAEVDAALFGGLPSHLFSRDTGGGRLRASYGPGVVFLDPDPTVNGGHVLTSHHRTSAPISTSLDAAVSFVEKAVPGAVWLKKDAKVATIAVTPADPKGWARHHDGLGATFPLSLLVALVTCRIETLSAAVVG